MPRGIRNKNPGNIRENHLVDIEWDGEAVIDNDDEFEVFDSAFYGLRALAKILINYRKRHGIKTIRGIIERYAPGVENDTEAYIAAVSKSTGIPADKEIFIDVALDLLIPAIVKHENGINPYSDDLIGRAILAAKA